MFNTPVPLFLHSEPPPEHGSEVGGQSRQVVPASHTWLPGNGIFRGKEQDVLSVQTYKTQMHHCSVEGESIIPIRQLLLRVVYIITDEEPLWVFSLTIGYNAAIKQRYWRKPEEKHIQISNMHPTLCESKIWIYCLLQLTCQCCEKPNPSPREDVHRHWWDLPCYHEAAPLCVGVGLQ